MLPKQTFVWYTVFARLRSDGFLPSRQQTATDEVEGSSLPSHTSSSAETFSKRDSTICGHLKFS